MLIVSDAPYTRNFEYGIVFPSQTNTPYAPLAWNESERSGKLGFDWSCCRARPQRLNNRSTMADPAGMSFLDIRGWNSGYWPGILISPVHMMVTHHYYQVVADQRNSIDLLRRDNTLVRPQVKSVHANIAIDTTIIEFFDPVEGIEPMSRIADPVMMPDDTPVWVQGPQSRVYQTLARVGKFWSDETREWYAMGFAMKPVPGDLDSRDAIDLNEIPRVWSGDSGSIVLVMMPDGKPAYLAASYAAGILRRNAGPIEAGKSPFQRVREIVNLRGYDIESVVWPGSMPVPHRSADINNDGKVNGVDLGLLLAHFGRNESTYADLNRDGRVDARDLAILLAGWTPPEGSK